MIIRKFLNLIISNFSIKWFSVFISIFLILFLCTHKSHYSSIFIDPRVIKCFACTIFFGTIFAFLVKLKIETYIPLSCGIIFYIAGAGTFSLYTKELGIGFNEVQYELFFAETLVLILICLNRLNCPKFIISIIESIIIIISLLYIGYYISFDIAVTSETYFLLLQTNFEETLNFFSAYKITVLSSLVLFFVICIYIYICNKKYKFTGFGRNFVIFTLLICFILDYFMIFKEDHLYIHRDFKLAYGYFEQVKKMADMKTNLHNINANSNLRTVCLIIGESACRDYMNAYGYERENTPWLTKQSNNNNFILYDNVYSSYRATNKSLVYFLTEKSQYNNKEIYTSLNLIDVANASGFDTYWISKQGNLSNYREAYNVIAQRAKYKHFLEGAHYDEELLNYLNIPDFGNKKLIVVHLGGSHHPYKGYTNKFKKFSEDNVNDNYDNTILYTDYVMSEVFNILQQYNIDVFIYTSDHGESKEMLRNKFDFRMERIPFVIYFSDYFIQNNPEIFKIAKERQHAYFTTDMFYDSFLGLIGADKEYYMDNQNLFSKQYSFNKYNLMTEYGSKMISEDPYDIQ